jgi:hypothetical protein
MPPCQGSKVKGYGDLIKGSDQSSRSRRAPLTRFPCQSHRGNIYKHRAFKVLSLPLYVRHDEMDNQRPLPPFVPPSGQQKFHENTTVRSPGVGSSSQHPSWKEADEKSAALRAPNKARPGSNGVSVIHDQVWLYTFLVHTLAYLGVSGYINYTAITNDKQPITEDSDLGPIDM